MKEKICIFGSVFGGDGYSCHVKHIAEALDDIGYEVSIDCYKPQGWEIDCPDKILNILKRPISNETIIFIGLPQFWKMKIMERPKRFFGFLVWEGSKIPRYFLEHINQEGVNGILVPSTHTMLAIMNTGECIKPIFNVGEGVDTELFKRTEVQRDDKFIFCSNKGWSEGINDRGGVQYLIKAFKEEFKPNENVALLLKINISYCPQGWDFINEVKKINVNTEAGAKILLSLNNLKYKDLPSKVYSLGDCFVMPTRAEAFGLTMAEAMACEMPVIATGYGGQIDFINDENGILVDYKLEEVKHNIMFEGVEWAVPDIEDLKKKMRWAFNNKDKIKEMGKKAREKIVNEFQWKHSAEKIKAVLDVN